MVWWAVMLALGVALVAIVTHRPCRSWTEEQRQHYVNGTRSRAGRVETYTHRTCTERAP